MAVGPFLDTSVMLAGLIDFGPQSAPAQSVLHAVAENIAKDPATAWHCCLEFFSVATRLPAEYRLTPVDALHLLEAEIFERVQVHDLPAGDRLPMLRTASRDLTIGGRIYDAHIAEVRARGRCARRGHRQPAALPRRPPARNPRRDPDRVPRVVEENVIMAGDPRWDSARRSAA